MACSIVNCCICIVVDWRLICVGFLWFQSCELENLCVSKIHSADSPLLNRTRKSRSNKNFYYVCRACSQTSLVQSVNVFCFFLLLPAKLPRFFVRSNKRRLQRNGWSVTIGGAKNLLLPVLSAAILARTGGEEQQMFPFFSPKFGGHQNGSVGFNRGNCELYSISSKQSQ